MVNLKRIEAGELLFQYQNAEGEFVRAVTIEEIPEKVRAKVQVIDLSLSPAERRADRFIQLFDLRAAASAGGYTGQVIPRRALESALAAKEEMIRQETVVMYSASWCGVCRKARAFMESSKIPFIERDIERDDGAEDELKEKARRAGVAVSGVPVFDVAGQLLRGFDPNALLSALKRETH